MPTELTEIQGIGPHTASILTTHGYNFAEDIAKAAANALANVPGFGVARATQIIASAKDIVAANFKEKKKPSKSEPGTFKVKKVKKLKKKTKSLTKKKKNKEAENDKKKAKKTKKKAKNKAKKKNKNKKK